MCQILCQQSEVCFVRLDMKYVAALNCFISGQKRAQNVTGKDKVIKPFRSTPYCCPSCLSLDGEWLNAAPWFNMEKYSVPLFWCLFMLCCQYSLHAMHHMHSVLNTLEYQIFISVFECVSVFMPHILYV